MKMFSVSGACRGVGKTHVALRLCEILDDTVYAKIGHGVKNTSKPANFFTTPDEFLIFVEGLGDSCRYCIVESNNHAICKIADLRIYIDAPKNAVDVRPDAAELRELADIVIAPTPEASSEQNMLLRAEVWRRIDEIPREKIPFLEMLIRDQQQYLA